MRSKPIRADIGRDLILRRDNTSDIPAFQNGSLVLLPKPNSTCGVLAKRQDSASSCYPNQDVNAYWMDPQALFVYIARVNIWYLRVIIENKKRPHVRGAPMMAQIEQVRNVRPALNVQQGDPPIPGESRELVREQLYPPTANLPRSTFITTGFIVPPALLQNFAEVNRERDTEGREVDLQALETLLDPATSRGRTGPIGRTFNRVENYYTADRAVVDARDRGLSANRNNPPIQWNDLGLPTIRPSFNMEISNDFSRRWAMALTIIVEELNLEYPDPQRRLGDGFRRYADSVRNTVIQQWWESIQSLDPEGDTVPEQPQRNPYPPYGIFDPTSVPAQGLQGQQEQQGEEGGQREQQAQEAEQTEQEEQALQQGEQSPGTPQDQSPPTEQPDPQPDVLDGREGETSSDWIRHVEEGGT